MNAVWELRLFGTDRHGSVRRKVYTFVIDECGQGYATASAEAKRLAKLDGLTDPKVWAATRLREVPDGLQRPDLLSSGSTRPSSRPPPGVVVQLRSEEK